MRVNTLSESWTNLGFEDGHSLPHLLLGQHGTRRSATGQPRRVLHDDLQLLFLARDVDPLADELEEFALARQLGLQAVELGLVRFEEFVGVVG